jgi:hypothetical protein
LKNLAVFCGLVAITAYPSNTRLDLIQKSPPFVAESQMADGSSAGGFVDLRLEVEFCCRFAADKQLITG